MTLRNERMDFFLNRCQGKKLFPGAVYLIGEGERIIAHGATGHAVVDPLRSRMDENTIFDLASLTKPLCTALLSIILIRHRIFSLDDPIRKFLHFFNHGDGRKINIIHLLTHTSGLPRWSPLYAHGSSIRTRIRYLSTITLGFMPGDQVLYGCPAYIVMDGIIREAAGERIDRLFQELIAEPLGLKDTGFNPPLNKRIRIAASEKGNRFERRLAGRDAVHYRGFRKDVIWGRVHDHNAFAMGGVSGNAGLFSTAQEMFALAKEFLGIGGKILDGQERRMFFRNRTPGSREDRAVGWQIASTRGSSAGRYISEGSIGHTGFTGVSLWIDPREGRTYILLTNRTHPSYRDFNMNAVRRRFHAIASSLS